MGHDWADPTEDETNQLKKSYGTENGMWDMIRYPKHNVLSPRCGLKLVDSLKDMPLREDDIWLVTFPKCGTTWIQETTTMLINNVDKEYAKVPLELRSPFLDLDAWYSGMEELYGEGETFNTDLDIPEIAKAQAVNIKKGNLYMAEKMTGRRVIKTHYPMDFLPDKIEEKAKVIYVARGPKDCAVSYYHFMLSTSDYTQNFNTFAHQFMAGLVMYGDYWNHIASGWKLREHPNVKFIWFEEMKKDSKKVIEELTEFLGHPLSQEKIDQLVNHVSFDVMKNNPAANPMALMKEQDGAGFMRSGKVGDWKNHFTSEEIAKFDHWVAENLARTGIQLPN